MWKLEVSLARSARFDAPTCLVSSLWFSSGLAVSLGEAAKLLLFKGIKAGCNDCDVVLRGRRGTSWHSHVSVNVSKIVVCDRHNTFARFSAEELNFSWQAQHFRRVALCALHSNAPHSTLYTLHSTLYIPHFTHCTLHSTLYTPHSTLHTLYSTLYTLHSTLYTPTSTLYTPHFTLHLSTLHFTVYAVHSTLYTPHFILYTPHFTFHTLHTALYTPHFTLQTRHSTLYTLHLTLYTLHSNLHTLHSTLHTPPFHFTLYSLHCTLHTPHFTLHTLQSTLHTLHFTLFTPHFTLHTLHSTLHTLHSTLYALHFTLHTIHFTLPLYTPHFTLHTLHSTLYTPHSTSTRHTLQSTLFGIPHSTVHWYANRENMDKTDCSNKLFHKSVLRDCIRVCVGCISFCGRAVVWNCQPLAASRLVGLETRPEMNHRVGSIVAVQGSRWALGMWTAPKGLSVSMWESAAT